MPFTEYNGACSSKFQLQEKSFLWNSVDQKFYNNSKIGYFLRLMNHDTEATQPWKQDSVTLEIPLVL